jgi:hypothetical protein
MRNVIPFFVKFFKANNRAHAEQFVEGKLFMKRLSYFQDLERDPGRADRYEATAIWWQPNHLSIQFKDHPELNVSPADLAGPVSVAFDHHRDLHIFCMSAVEAIEFEPSDNPTDEDVRKLKEQLKFSDECLKLGEIAVIVKTREFLDRLKRALDKTGYKCEARLVEYYDPATFHGQFPFHEIPFRKRAEFSYEKEYRIAVHTNTKGQDPLEIEIGNIGDISATVASATLNDGFTRNDP